MAVNRHAVKAFMDLTGVSVSKLAADAGEDRANLTHALAGRRRLKPSNLASFAGTLGVPIAALLGPSEDPLTELAKTA